jgi:hypothetical protein
MDGIATIMSGTPLTVFDSNDVSEQGGEPEITGLSANRPNLIPGQNSERRASHPGASQRLSTPQSRSEFPCTAVSVPRAEISRRGPGYADWDFSAFKNIRG